MEHSVIEFGWNGAFLSGLFSIILIDVILSGDNSIVIALAVKTLPAEKRRLGIIIGAGAAAVMRIAFTFIASHLMQVPYLKLVGGLLILWIALKLLSENEDADPASRQVRTMFHAIWIIMVADFTMSLDNVLGVAGASKGSALLLWFGLGLSIPLVMFASGMLSKLMDRFPVIVLLGAMVLGKVGGEMIVGDPALRKYFEDIPHVHMGGSSLGAGLVVIVYLWMKHRAKSKTADSAS
ncbi:MAG TPA: tellurium resistance protein TerC [Fibrobacteres bacterium]|jgi:YjbE family integral membrane protein|nr:tellurium resistance protein TerC [Fibrobacterota bacterium]